MSYARPFGQAAPSASPWTAGMPPGLQQPQSQASTPQQHQGPLQMAQPMFNQPMGAFDLTGGGAFAQTGPAQMAPAPGQWAQPMQAMQAPMQFVPNAGPFMHQPMQPQQMQQRFHPQQQLQQQRSMHHQRSLSAPRAGVNQNNKRVNNNQNNSFGGGQWQPNNRQNQQQQQQNNHNNNNNRSGRQQPRLQQQNQQKGQQTKVTQNNNGTNNNNNNNSKQQNQQKQQQEQQPQQGAKKGPVKVTKVAKKLAVAKANKVSNAQTDTTNKVQAADSATAGDQQQADKPQSKTAERKQFKLQARKNAESLKLNKMPVIKATKSASAGALGKPAGSDASDTPIDQSQLKCVPAVFGFVCKACDVFLRDRFARREHIDSESHMEKFTAFEAEQQRLESEKAADTTEAVAAAKVSNEAEAANKTEGAAVKSEPADIEAGSAGATTGASVTAAAAAEAKIEPKEESSAPNNDDDAAAAATAATEQEQ